MTTRIAPPADAFEEAVLEEGTSIWHLMQVHEHVAFGWDYIVERGAYIGGGAVMGGNYKVQNYALVYEPAHLTDGTFISPTVMLTNDHFSWAVNPDGSFKSAVDQEPVGVIIKQDALIDTRVVRVAPVRVGA